MFFKRFLGLLLSSLLLACEPKPQQDQRLEDYKSVLADHQALIRLEIAGDTFYANECIFKGSISLSNGTMAINLKNQFDGQTIVSLKMPDRLKDFPWEITFDERKGAQTQVLIGKIIETNPLKGLGYVMTSGSLTVKQMDPEYFHMDLHGKGVKYGVDLLLEQPVEIKGTIVYKSPHVSFDHMSWSDLQ
ncbi:hypothetical protein CLV98_101600 [Dyadobacter jejuensis]|uniref:YceI-like domain-containing protein n=1 Tax=Dyadobacter jejuensis TaxID=1082580 RepID=A0A316ASV4_9BACT|nr:hypothetical protein [Dyadobacter jejuensis]PWJ60416.1 hypothetical protein CLV98_101600 [Dyadobacter jejuensis]